MSWETECVARRAEKRKSFQGDGRDVLQRGGALVRPAGRIRRRIRPVDSFSTITFARAFGTSAQSRPLASLFDDELQIEYWRNGPVEMRPLANIAAAL